MVLLQLLAADEAAGLCMGRGSLRPTAGCFWYPRSTGGSVTRPAEGCGGLPARGAAGQKLHGLPADFEGLAGRRGAARRRLRRKPACDRLCQPHAVVRSTSCADAGAACRPRTMAIVVSRRRV